MSQISSTPATIIFQSAKLGDLPWILKELDWAESLLREGVEAGRIFGVSGGNLAALAFGLALAARKSPQTWGKARNARRISASFLRRAHSRNLRALKLNPLYGFYTLMPLRRWVASRLRAYTGRDDWRVSELGVPLYLCAMDRDAIFCMYGPPDDSLQCDYHFVHIPPPQDAPLPGRADRRIEHPPLHRFQPGERSMADTTAARPSWTPGPSWPTWKPPTRARFCASRPYAAIRQWPLNWFTSSFVMHSAHERNQTLLAGITSICWTGTVHLQEQVAKYSPRNMPSASPQPGRRPCGSALYRQHRSLHQHAPIGGKSRRIDGALPGNPRRAAGRVSLRPAGQRDLRCGRLFRHPGGHGHHPGGGRGLCARGRRNSSDLRRIGRGTQRLLPRRPIRRGAAP